MRPRGLRRRNLDDDARAMIGDLSRDRGKTFGGEPALRREFKRRTGYTPGERSIGRTLLRMVRAGEIAKQRIRPGGRLVTGIKTNHGFNQYWLPSRIEQRKARQKAKRRAVTARSFDMTAHVAAAQESARVRELADHVAVATPSAALIPAPFRFADLIPRPPTDAPSAEADERTRAERDRQLADLAAAAARLEPPDDPPDK